ncbi:MAG: hypothetical protein ACLGP3_08475 [Acidobacteriota bacterium]
MIQPVSGSLTTAAAPVSSPPAVQPATPSSNSLPQDSVTLSPQAQAMAKSPAMHDGDGDGH